MRDALVNVARRSGQIALYPVGRLFTALWRRGPDLPRRVPNLARFTRSERFRRLRIDVVPWVTRHFDLIEALAPWLVLASQQVADYCATNMTTRALSFPPDSPSVQCQRTMLRIYGVDGSLSGRLDDLAAVIGAIGWGTVDGETTTPVSDLARLNPPTRPISWRPVPGFGLPDGLRMMPVARQFPSWRWVHMQIGWTSSGLSTEVVTRLGLMPATDGARGTPVYEPIEMTAVEMADAVRLTLASHEHVLAIRIECVYYIHLNATRGSDRIPRRLLLYRRRAPGG